MIVDNKTFHRGKYTVHQRQRFDNPAWPLYIIRHGERIVGRQFSYPSESDCEWLDRERAIYAAQSAAPQPYGHTHRRGRPRKADAEREMREAIAA